MSARYSNPVTVGNTLTVVAMMGMGDTLQQTVGKHLTDAASTKKFDYARLRSLPWRSG